MKSLITIVLVASSFALTSGVAIAAQESSDTTVQQPKPQPRPYTAPLIGW